MLYGAIATTGSEVPPTPTTGYVPLYLVDLAFGQTTIAQSQILTAGPSVGTGVPSTYPQAPFLTGLLNSHHSGGAGQAPKIKLASETQGILPMANLPASSAASGGGLSTVRTYAGNPNGAVAGTAGVIGVSPPDLLWDTVDGILWTCATTGTATTAVWVNVAAGTQIPAGTIAYTALAVAPTGWISASGSLLSRTTYGNLWAAAQASGNIVTEATWAAGYSGAFSTGDLSTTFRIPDFRGVSIRGLDGGRGLDSSRAIGSYQGDTFASHNHGVSDPTHGHGVSDPTHAHSVSDGGHAHTTTGPTIGYQGAANSYAGVPESDSSNSYGTRTWTSGVAGAGIGIYGAYTGIGIAGAYTGISIAASGSTETRGKNVAAVAIIKY